MIKSKSKKVYQYDLKGNFIGEYINCKVASQITNVSTTQINRCCNGHFKSTKGYIFSYNKDLTIA